MEYSLFSEVYHMNLPASVPVIVQVIIFKFIIFQHKVLSPSGAALCRLGRSCRALALGCSRGALALGRSRGALALRCSRRALALRCSRRTLALGRSCGALALGRSCGTLALGDSCRTLTRSCGALTHSHRTLTLRDSCRTLRSSGRTLALGSSGRPGSGGPCGLLLRAHSMHDFSAAFTAFTALTSFPTLTAFAGFTALTALILALGSLPDGLVFHRVEISGIHQISHLIYQKSNTCHGSHQQEHQDNDDDFLLLFRLDALLIGGIVGGCIGIHLHKLINGIPVVGFGFHQIPAVCLLHRLILFRRYRGSRIRIRGRPGISRRLQLS